MGNNMIWMNFKEWGELISEFMADKPVDGEMPAPGWCYTRGPLGCHFNSEQHHFGWSDSYSRKDRLVKAGGWVIQNDGATMGHPEGFPLPWFLPVFYQGFCPLVLNFLIWKTQNLRLRSRADAGPTPNDHVAHLSWVSNHHLVTCWFYHVCCFLPSKTL